ncbi:mitochondrial glycoprotein [Amylostereum chailletii]|nr:mitochondrial glycoprotein [Amylostereum chailletii]
MSASALRTLRQLAAASSRTLAARSLTSSARQRLPAALARSAVVPAARSFTVSARRLGEGTSDLAVSQKLAEELQYEKDAVAEPEPEFLKTFKEAGIWTIEDTPGSDEVTLHRKFGNEDIRVMFSIADIQSQEDYAQEEGESENPEVDLDVSYPLRCSFTITKPTTPGALTIDAMAQDGAFMIDNVSFYKEGKLATELTAEADWKRRGIYIGPQFDTLDVGVQEEFEKFLQERGINESLAGFIPEYSEHKEQKEYVSWLGNVKSFIDA